MGAPTPPADGVSYTVQPEDVDDGLVAIARRLYGDQNRWVALYEANRAVIGNNPAVVRPGQQLAVPGLCAGGSAGGGDGSAGPGGARLYDVQVGDLREGLRGLARRLCGDAGRWRDLYAVNRGIIGEDPDRLQAGQRLIVPR